MKAIELRQIRKDVLRLDQVQLGKCIGKGSVTISRYENGARPIPADVAIPVRVMATSPDQMIELFREKANEDK